MVRYPIADLARLRVGAQAAAAGRVTYAEEGRILLADPSGVVEVGVRNGPPLGSWVTVEGHWGGVRIERATVTVRSEARDAFPKVGGEWLRLNGEEGRRIAGLQARAAASREARAWFDQRRFLEVETPLAVPSPGLDLHLEAFEVPGMGARRWLQTSPEYQMKRLIAGGLTRIYQLGPCFRRGEIGSNHHPQFTMLEWYRGFAGSAEIMRDTEELVAALAVALTGSTQIAARGRVVDVKPPWRRLPLRDAFAEAGLELDSLLADEERFFRILVESVEPQLGRLRPVFLTGWPASMASLARLDPKNPSVADRFEAYVGGVELCNGFGELIDPVEQRARLRADQARREAEGKTVYPIDERFLGALEEGLPPCGGNALGFDRLLMFVLGVSAIDEVVAIPAQRL